MLSDIILYIRVNVTKQEKIDFEFKYVEKF